VKIVQCRWYANKMRIRSIDGTITLEDTEVKEEKLVLPIFCPKQILQVLNWGRAQASALRGFFIASE
jgi:hypothetical protein